MATTRTVALSNDLSMDNTSTVQASARAGNGLFANSGPVSRIFNAFGMAAGGPGLASNEFQQCEVFFRFVQPATPATHDLVSAWLDVRSDYYESPIVRSLQFREHDFGGAPDPGTGTGGGSKGDWVPLDGPAPGPITSKTLLASVPGISQSSPAFRPQIAAGEGLYARLESASATPLDVVGVTDRQTTGAGAQGAERVGVLFSEYGDDAYRPNIHISTIAKSTLQKLGAASAQLSDGTSVFVDEYELSYSTDNVVDNAIATLATGTAANQFDDETIGWQTMSVTVDASDNIWVVAKGGAGVSAIVVQGFLKGSGYSWTAQPVRQVTAPAFGTNTDVPVNNVTTCWHPTANAGSLMVMTSRRAGVGKTSQVAYMVLSCNNLIAGANPVLASGVNPSWLGLTTPTDLGSRPTNDTGNGLDVQANGLYGYAICWDGTSNTAYYVPNIRAGRYLLTSVGGFASTLVWDEDDTFVELEPETKAKILVIDGSKIALCYGDRIHVYDNGGSRIVEGASIGITLYNKGVDWLYDRATDRIWVYYMRTANTLSRRGFSMQTGSYTADVDISTTVGAVGSTNPHIRLPRGVSNERTVRIEIGNRSSGGTLSTIVLNDTLNVAPFAPTLTDRAGFNASDPATFQWAFADPNTDDAQTAYQLVIRRTVDNVIVHDTGKVASGANTYVLPATTLINDTSYYWQVRVWDLADVPSVYSATDTFLTVSTAITTIDNPPVDNPSDATGSTYHVTWSTTVIVQAKYRLRLVNTQTAQVVLDTGFVTSTDTFFDLTGLQDGITYRIEVTVRNNVDVESQTGTRLLTPDYIEPVTPILTATAVAESVDPDTGRMVGGYILLTVDNPPESGGESVPIANPGCEVDTTGWFGSGGALARSTGQFHSGVASGQLTPDGVAATPLIGLAASGSPTVDVAEDYEGSVWVRSSAGWTTVRLSLAWLNAGNAIISETLSAIVNVPAATWTEITAVGRAPDGTVKLSPRVQLLGTPPNTNIFNVDDFAIETAPGNEPDPTSNDLYKRELPNGTAVLIASVANDGSYRDYNVRSNRQYEYFVRAVV
jgi:hypothetical protein